MNKQDTQNRRKKEILLKKPRVSAVLGACGQVGVRLVEALQARDGYEAVWALDKRPWPDMAPRAQSRTLDVMDEQALEAQLRHCQATEVYHLASMLSAQAEAQPRAAWRLGIDGLFHVLTIAHTLGLRVFYPSSIAVCGPHSNRNPWPQRGYNDPQTIYGIAKQTGEALGAYYVQKYGVDVRMIRYPGLIGGTPGGGVTDFACHMYAHAQQNQPYTCFIDPDTPLPLMAIEDAIQGTLQLMEADATQLNEAMGYNIHAFSATPRRLAQRIQSYCPQFHISYQPDFRNAIAGQWPERIDDTAARRDWQWTPQYDLQKLTEKMLASRQEPKPLT